MLVAPLRSSVPALKKPSRRACRPRKRVSAAWFTVVPHMAWSIAMETVRVFLRENDHGFIVGDARKTVAADGTTTEAPE